MKKLSFIFLIVLIQITFVHAEEHLKAFWSFEDSTARDFSGNGYHGTMKNTPTPALGHNGIGTSMRFEGSGVNTTDGDHILLPRIPFESYNEFTISMWVKEEGVTQRGGEAYLFFGDHNSGWLGIANFIIQPDNGQTERYLHASVGSSLYNIEALIEEYSGSYEEIWKYYTITYKDEIISFYIDAKEIGSKYQPKIIYGNNAALARHWWSNGSLTSTRFTGWIDDVKIYDKALTEKEILCDFTKLDIPIKINLSRIDFEEICIGENSDKTIVITNTSSEALDLTLALKNSNSSFQINQDKIFLPPNSNEEIQIKFSPKKIGILQDTLVITEDECSIPIELPLSGISILRNTIRIPNLEWHFENETLNINTLIKNHCDILEEFESEYELKLGYNPYVLNYQNSPFQLIETEQKNQELIYLTFKGKSLLSNSDTLLSYFEAMPLFYHSGEYPILIDTIIWDNPFIRTNIINGSISFEKVCQEELLNLKYFSKTEVNLFPNPITDDFAVKIKSEEEGFINIEILNIYGEIIHTQSYLNANLSEIEIIINGTEYSSGIYFLVVKTPLSYFKKKIIKIN